jgi:hypothetical protein
MHKCDCSSFTENTVSSTMIIIYLALATFSIINTKYSSEVANSHKLRTLFCISILVFEDYLNLISLFLHHSSLPLII